MSVVDGAQAWQARRRAVVRDAVAVGIATGAYGVGYGALAAASGLNLLEVAATSLLIFTGGSQFAFIGVVAAGGSSPAAALSAILLGVRNAFYGLRLASLLRLRGGRRALGAQLVIDESTAMALANSEDPRARRLAFWATGLSVFALWNVATVLGALLGTEVADPATLGLDAAVPAAFLALLWPRLTDPRARVVAVSGAVAALVLVPVVPAGVPVLGAAVVAVALGLGWRSWRDAVPG